MSYPLGFDVRPTALGCSTSGMVRFAAAENVAPDFSTRDLEDQRLAQRRARDVRWIAAIQAGDEAAFTEMFYDFYAPMLAAARLRGSTLDEAEEVVQQVFVNVWQMGSSWRPQESVGAYLLGALRRQLTFIGRTHTRRRGALDRFAQRAAASVVLRSGAPADEQLSANELAKQAKRAIESLSSRLYETFVLAKYQKWTTEELATHLGITEGAVRMNLKRAYSALRRQLSEYL